MLQEIIKSELQYKNCFSTIIDYDTYYSLEDLQIQDMRAYNNIIIKPGITLDIKKELIAKQLQHRKSERKDFLKVISFDPINVEDLDFIKIKPEIEIYDYMSIFTESASSLKSTDNVEIMHADRESLYEAGKFIDIEANKLSMGEEFAIRRINRKIKVYKDKSIPLEFFVCYYKGEPAGNCELFLDDQIAKIEDFDILEKFQKKGLGTHFLKELLLRVKEKGINHAYVLTDHYDSAKEMYQKCGFKYEGNVTELLFTI